MAVKAATTRTIIIPDDLYERVKEAAAQNYRSTAGEILALLEEALKARAADREAA